MKEKKYILITGAAGFIGYYSIQKFCNAGYDVIGIDSINSYYEQSLKYDRLAQLGIDSANIRYGRKVQSLIYSNFKFIKLDFADQKYLESLLLSEKFDLILHLGAQAGVRYSLTHPEEYIRNNLLGFSNILELARKIMPTALLYASSSSVYGLNQKIPFSESDRTDSPVSLYAATKKSNEILGYSYSNLYKIRMVGLRFFTVYGPWGRPDMAYYKFTKAILSGKPIDVYNNGNMRRDFTYIDDIIEGIYRLADSQSEEQPVSHDIYNIGNNSPINLLEMIEILEKILGKKTEKVLLPMQPGDVFETYADIDKLKKAVDYKPNTNLEFGLEEFVKWYKSYYRV